ncbi:hypothetical protein Acr_07g0011210 [Actinidia rufa]|uniref:Uncharacterized protein n=1 Tax=Actinidia rufa TaxID=165716 RepID=A0A7J0EWT4_9ERIC|nr:hypothetical protein Acr_07g0011210 [Actinidia rufa]
MNQLAKDEDSADVGAALGNELGRDKGKGAGDAEGGISEGNPKHPSRAHGRSQIMDIIWLAMFPVDHIPFLETTIHKDYTIEIGKLPGGLANLYERARQHSRA